MNEYKTCTKCLQEKAITDFSKHNGKKSAKSGYRASCKKCDVAYNREYRAANREKVNEAKRLWAAKNLTKKKEMDARYYQKNKDKISQYLKTWVALNSEKIKEYRNKPEVKQKKALADRKYAASNPEVNRIASKNYRLRNPDKTAKSAKAYRQRNPELMRLKSHQRRVLIKNNLFLVTKVDVKKILAKNCLYCGSSQSLELDHVIPLSRGGRHSLGNLVASCRKCNASKGAKYITEWRKSH